MLSTPFITGVPKVSAPKLFIRPFVGALIVYDITDVDSFQKMSMWVTELRQQLGPDLPIIIVGNKCDLENNR
jgi:GTPase SAR1 family protein